MNTQRQVEHWTVEPISDLVFQAGPSEEQVSAERAQEWLRILCLRARMTDLLSAAREGASRVVAWPMQQEIAHAA